MSMLNNQVEVVFSFDTTGSMYPCLTQVRRRLRETITRLAREIPGIRIGIIAHGDYCDARTTYLTKMLDLTHDADAIVRFVDSVGQTGGGGNGGEAYELVMNLARDMSWTPNYTKVFVMIGDEPPHTVEYRDNVRRLDWKNEARGLADMGIPIYAVQCLNRRESTFLYRGVAEISGGLHLNLDQFANITEMVLAICYKQVGNERLEAYEAEIVSERRMNRNLDDMFATMMQRAVREVAGSARYPTTATRRPRYAATDLRAVPSGRFQVLHVDHDSPIKQFVQEQGVTFKVGRGFYEFMKAETIQDYKEVVLMDRQTGDLFSGDAARELAGIPVGVKARLKPAILDKYRIFVQSTSANRKLIGGYGFLYEVDDWMA